MLKRKINILHFVPMLKSGGIETLLYEYYSNMDKSKYKFSFVTHELGGSIYDKMLKENIDIYYLPSKKKGLWGYFKNLQAIFSKGKFDIVHVHQGHMSFFPLFFAKKAKIEHRIVHIHWTSQKEFFLKKALNMFFSFLVKKLSSDYFACSEHAAKYLYGKRFVNAGMVKYMKNAIDLTKFFLADDARLNIKKSLNIKEKYVIAMVGRFTSEKNHNFALNVFQKIQGKNCDTIFIFIGDGPLRYLIESNAKLKNVYGKCLFLGNRDDVASLLSIVDILIHPSLYEGLGISVIEAQACGVKCVVSENVPREVALTDLVTFIKLNRGSDYWCSRILSEIPYVKINRTNEIRLGGYDIFREVQQLEKYYFEIFTRSNSIKEKNNN